MVKGLGEIIKNFTSHIIRSICGECVLYETGGVCPIVRCPKGMLNRPCGGMYDGKCEVGGYKRTALGF